MKELYDLVLTGQRLRGLRIHYKLSLVDVSKKMNITQKFIRDIELGLRGMSLTTLVKFANLYHTTTDYILFGTLFDDEPPAITRMRCNLKAFPEDSIISLDDCINEITVKLKEKQ